MSLRAWKVATFASLGVAAVLAVHPLRASDARGAEISRVNREGDAPRAAGGWFGFFPPASMEATDPVTPAIARLHAARTEQAICEAVEALGATRDERAVAEIADLATSKTRPGTRECATSTLGKMQLAAARSWLGELATDSDEQLRSAALIGLAKQIDPEGRAIVLGIADAQEGEVRMDALAALASEHVPEVTPRLLALVKSGTPSEVARAITMLGDSGDPSAVTALATLTRDSLADRRNAAIESLGKIGTPEAIAALTALLPEAPTRDALMIVRALSDCTDPAARKAILAAATSDRRDVASAALQQLRRMPGEDARALMLAFLDAGGEPSHLAVAFEYFAATNDASALPRIVELARSGAPNTASLALNALGGFDDKRAQEEIADLARTPGPLQDDALGMLARVPGADAEARAISLEMVRDQDNAGHALQRLAEDPSPEARAMLIDLAKSDSTNATTAMAELATRRDPESMAAITALATTPGKHRHEALNVLQMNSDPRNLGTFTSALRDPDVSVQRIAIAGLARLGGAEADRMIASATTSGDKSVRISATRALRNHDPSTSTPLLETLVHDPDEAVAAEALMTLATTDPARAVSTVESHLRSGTPYERTRAIDMVDSLGAADRQRIYADALRGDDETFLSNATQGLARMQTDEAKATLVDLLTRPSASDAARKAAAEALTSMGPAATRPYEQLIAKYKELPEHVESESADDTGDEGSE